MLSLLHIENIAVIECADITFHKGFNVLTGETGAGKSIVIDAISAVLGERAYRDMIRTGAEKASVRGVFTDVPELSWFEENGVEYDPETIIQRDIYLDGRNICRVNGALVTVSILRKLGVQLINIHGQHDSASLFDEDNHLLYLDAFADNKMLMNGYLEKYQSVSALQSEIRRMTMDESEKLRRMETLRYQIEEISKAELEAGEDEVLEQRRKILQNAEKLSDGICAAAEYLYGNDDIDGAATMLAEAERIVKGLEEITDSQDNIDRLDSVKKYLKMLWRVWHGSAILSALCMIGLLISCIRCRMWRMRFVQPEMICNTLLMNWKPLRHGWIRSIVCAGSTVQHVRKFWNTWIGQRQNWMKSNLLMTI